jgi:hypothetical protein
VFFSGTENALSLHFPTRIASVEEHHMSEAPLAARVAPEELLTPLNIIRTETVLSKLPIHNLSKKGSIDIRIARKNAAGEVELLWSVSPSRAHGEPRQLAYKLDTLVINRRLDEGGRPVAKRLRLGTLKEICSELDLPVSGRIYAELRRALMQNALAGITAKLSYRTLNGHERTLEAVFTRYGVVFTGEKFPDGERADAVYLLFNDPYLEVLNNAPLRPLDYDYLKVLPPGAQRFYEILSYRIYAAIRHGLPHAKISYSDYCTYSAQQHYTEYDRVKKQMYKLHRPHLASGYLRRVRIEPIEGGDDEGHPDWMMFYVPGRRARHEYKTYHQGTGRRLSDSKPHGEAVSRKRTLTVMPAENTTGPTGGPAEIFPPSVITAADADVKQLDLALITADELVARFHKLTKSIENYRSFPGSREPGQAAELLDSYGPDKALYIVEYAVQAATRTKFEMRTFGALKQYVQEAAESFERHTAAMGANEELRRLREERNHEAELWAERGCELLDQLPPEEYQPRFEATRRRLSAEYPNVLDWGAPAMETSIRSAMASDLAKEARLESFNKT